MEEIKTRRKYWTPDKPMPDLTLDERRKLIDRVKTVVQQHNLTYTWLIARLADVGLLTDKYEVSATVNGTRLGAKADEILRRSVDILAEYEDWEATHERAGSS